MKKQKLHNVICGMAALVLMAAFAGEAAAATRQGGWELGPYLGYVFFDSDSGIEDDFGLGGRVGYFFTKNHEIEFDYLMIGGEDDFGAGIDVDVTTWTLGYAYNWTGNKDMVPFVAFAIGSTNTDAGSFGDEDDSTFAVGGGVRFFTTDNFAVRLGGNLARVDSDPDVTNNWMFDAGVSWILGGKK